MNNSLYKNKILSFFLTAVFAFLQISPAYSAMVDNQQLLQQANHELSIQEISSLLEQGNVQDRLIAMGVDPQVASERIQSMTAAELAELQVKLEELPAGEGVLGAVLVVFIVLVITDMLGATDVFPFVKNINK